MRKTLLILGVICLVACILSLAFAALNLLGYRNMQDGSSAQFSRMHRRMILFAAVGLFLGAAGIISLILRVKS